MSTWQREQLIEDRFSIARMTSTTEALYRDLLSRTARIAEPQSIPPDPAAQEARSSWLAH